MKYNVCKLPDGSTGLELDLGKVKLPELEGKDYLRCFTINTFQKVQKQHETVLLGVNNFMGWLPKNEQTILASYLIGMNAFMRDRFAKGGIKDKELIGIMKEVGKFIVELNDTIGLFPKLVAYVEGNVNIYEYKKAGTRPQDSKPTTYYREDLVLLNAAILLSKLMTGILGTLIYHLEQMGVDTTNRDVLAYNILDGVYQQECYPVVNKLRVYIDRKVGSAFKDDTPTVLAHGYTKNFALSRIISILIVRNFVNLDLYQRENTNTIAVINTNVTSLIKSHIGTTKQTMVKTRVDKSASDSDQSRSSLEIDSIVSRNTADFPILMEYYVDIIVPRLLELEGIGKRTYNRCYKDNMNTHIEYGPLNKLIIESMFSKHFGGSRGLGYIRASQMVKLFTVVQLMLFNKGYHTLAHGLTSMYGIGVKSTLSDAELRLEISYSSLREYERFNSQLKQLPHGEFACKAFQARISEVVKTILQHDIIYNTPEEAINVFGLDVKNGTEIQFTTEYISELCQLLSEIHNGYNDVISKEAVA